MEKAEKCVLTNMCMVRDGSRVLVQDRLNPNWPGITFPGGHVERGESFVRSVVREMKEETGLDIDHVRLCGVKQFQDVREGFRYIVLFYTAEVCGGTLTDSDEGRVFWIERDALPDCALADGFESMLAVFENEALSENYYHQENNAWLWENL